MQIQTDEVAYLTVVLTEKKQSYRCVRIVSLLGMMKMEKN
jgi:hypothetical protein